MGTFKKLKKMKRKYFILRRGQNGTPSKLEYYPSERKWRMGNEPKRSFLLKSCFNISQKLHPKHKHVICLYMREECFSIVFDNEEEMSHWLSGMQELQFNEIDGMENCKTKSVYEHVWQVVVDDRELECTKDLNGPFCLALTSKSLSLIKICSTSENFENLEFPLMSIRRCGHSGKHFFIELGRSAITGAGGIWMETEGTVVAQNMHETILGAMKSSRNKEDMGPHYRPRSASTSENSKPITTRRPVGVVLPQPTLSSALGSSREHCNLITTQSHNIALDSFQDASYRLSSADSGMRHGFYRESSRPHSVYAWPSSSSPSLNSFGFSPSPLSTSLYSNGSCMSFEENEGSQQNPLGWYSQNQLADAGFSIDTPITEMPNEYLMMSPTDDNMNIIPKQSDYLNMNPSNSSPALTEDSSSSISEVTKSSPKSVDRVDYMDMNPTNTGYLTMSTIQSPNIDMPAASKKMAQSSSREAQDKKDGYMPMAPCGTSEESSVPMQDGYLSMSPLSSLPKQFNDGMFSQTSTSSSSNFDDDATEFKLDKVKSMLKHTDEEEDFIKPVRAYSIGSRKQMYEARARAYSMGSERPKMELEKSASSSVGNLKEVTKSCSAPILQDSAVLLHRMAMFSSEESQNDLMEIDYQKPEQKQMHLMNHETTESAKKPMPKARQRTSSHSAMPLLSLDEENEKNFRDTEMNDDGKSSEKMQEPSKAGSPTLPNYVEMDGIRGSQGMMLLTSSLENDKLPKDNLTINAPHPLKQKSFHALNIVSNTSINLAADGQESKKNSIISDTSVKMPVSIGDSTKGKLGVPTYNQNTAMLITSTQGDYINLMLNKPTPPQKINDAKNSTSDIGKLSVSSPDEPNYMNIKLGKPYTPLPNPALVSSSHSSESAVESMHSRYSTSAESEAVPTSNRSTLIRPKSFCSPTIKKQMSAPCVPPSLQHELISPGRKRSCPVTSTASLLRSTTVSPASSHRLLSSVSSLGGFLKIATNHSPEHKSTNKEDTGIFEMQYENVSLPSGSKSSSVRDDKELNYASLDLAPMNRSETPHSPSMLKLSHQSCFNDEEPLTYAEIDFTKSEGLRHTSGAFREGRI